jgi:large subunit ribosomal protein L25
MMQITTSVRAPKETTKVGSIPAVYYGAHQAATSIFIDAIEFKKVLAEAGESSSITLTTEHGNENAMIQAVQVHPVKGNVIHVDFYVLEKGQKVHVKTPIVFVGESDAVKAGGVLVKVMQELSVEGDPSKLPHEFTIDLSALVAMDSIIHVRDIKLPAGVELYHVTEDDVIVSISQAVEESETVTPVDLSTIEVEAKGKKEEAEEEAVA